MSATKPAVKVGATETSFRIIEFLSEQESLTLSELQAEAEIPAATLHNHLETLQALGYVVREGDAYRLAVRFLGLGESARRQLELFQVGRPEIERLAEQTGERVNLMIEEHGLGVHIDMAMGEEAVELDTYPGYTSPLHASSLGKAILAHLPEDRVESILNRRNLEAITEDTITDPESLRESLDRIRERGYSLDDEERLGGWRCVGAPIISDERVIGAVSVSGPVNRLKGDRWESKLPEAVQNTANVIEVNLSLPG